MTLSNYETEQPQDGIIRIQLTNPKDDRWRHPVKPVTGVLKEESSTVKVSYPENPKHLMDFSIQSGDDTIANFDGTRKFLIDFFLIIYSYFSLIRLEN